MTCSSCGQDNRAGARFCDNCGTALSGPAPQRSYAPPEALAEKIRRDAPGLEGERKQVTVLFADVSGSMDLAESVDAETWRRIMDRFFVVLCDGVHRYEGTVVQFTGDGVMALFGAPIAHEDHALRAAHAALHLCRELSRHAAEVRRDEGLNFSVRLGVNTGEVIAGAIGDDLKVDFTAIGHTVGLAKRMESLAEPGKVYVTGTTAAQIDGFFALRDLGPFDVKGVREAVPVFELAGRGAMRSRLDRARERGFSRFVGRDAELDVLEDALERALRGDGQVVGVVGEPGVGKSRLCLEFVQRVQARGVPVFRAAGAAHARKVPFHVSLEMLRGYFGIDDDTPVQEARERVAGRLLLLDDGLAAKLPLVLDFLGIADPERPVPRMDPGRRMELLLGAARELVHRHATREFAVNLVEDVHWIDDPSRVFLEALVDAVPGHRSLVIVNFRPEFVPGWRELGAYREIGLVPLGPGAVADLLDDLLGRHPSLDGLPAAIAERTGGNPFFVEEVVEALAEDGTLEGPRGERRLARSLGAISVPASVHDVLAARIDRLSDRGKSVLQAASAIGREFDRDVLGRVVAEDTRGVDRILTELVDGGFLVEADADAYAFRHPLTQEVAHGSLLAERRRVLHAAVARAMAEADGSRLDERAALIATHWQTAGEDLEAMRWHARAAGWSGLRDPREAVRHWREVRALCSGLEPGPETIGMGLAACMWMLQFSWRLGIDAGEVDALYSDGLRLVRELGDEVTEALLTTLWASVVGLSRDLTLAIGPASEAVATVRRAGRPDVEVPILIFLGYGLMVGGRYEDALDAVARGAELTREDRSVGAGVTVDDPHSYFLMLRAFVLAIMGRLSEAREERRRAAEHAAAAGDRETLGWCLMNTTWPAWVGDELDGVDENVVRSIELAEAQGSLFSRIWSRFNLGVSHLMHDRFDDAAEAFEQALELIRRHNTARECTPWIVTMLARAELARGEDERALELARGALSISEHQGVANVRPVARETLAAVLLAAGEPAEAVEALRVALDLIVSSGARGLEPRLRIALADALRTAGEDDAADAELRTARAVAEEIGARRLLRELAPA